jgi:undecaprenyl diphosphate synthase
MTIGTIPHHIGIIMDGNRRWAKKRGLPTLAGHERGYQKIKEVARWCKARGIKVVSVYAFSTENWRRSKKEVTYLMRLFKTVLTKDVDELLKDGVRLKIIGERGAPLPASLIRLMNEAEERTAMAGDLLLQVAINYGGRAEIVAAAKSLVRAGIKDSDITEDVFAQHLWSANAPDVDLLIRTSGEQRTSGFLTWAATYAELFFTPTLWPDFSERELDHILKDFTTRERRLGK